MQVGNDLITGIAITVITSVTVTFVQHGYIQNTVLKAEDFIVWPGDGRPPFL